MCDKFNQGGWNGVVDPYYQAPYAYKGNQWIGYDDANSLAIKVTFNIRMPLSIILTSIFFLDEIFDG